MPADTGELSALHEFAALSPKDRRDIVRHLTPSERQALERIMTGAGQTQAAEAHSDLELDGYSPWLARHVRRLLDKRHPAPASRATPKTRHALRALIESHAAKARATAIQPIDN